MSARHRIARVCHAANRELQKLNHDEVSPDWDDAPEWQRESALAGVDEALAGATPRELHDSWCAYKRADGWVFGPVKDADARTHPCLVAYDQLPEGQRTKDAVFGAIVSAMGGPA